MTLIDPQTKVTVSLWTLVVLIGFVTAGAVRLWTDENRLNRDHAYIKTLADFVYYHTYSDERGAQKWIEDHPHWIGDDP